MNVKNVALAALVAIALPAGAHAATVPNGSFESPNIGGFSYAPGPNTVDTTYTSIAGVAANGSAFGYNTTIGTQVGFLQANDSTFGTITQSVTDLVAGQRYALTFFASQRPGYETRVLPINVFFDNTLLGTVTPTSTSFVANSALSFIANGTTGSLTFGGSIIPGDINAAIDGVSVSAVPEPAAWAMMIGGFGMVGSTLRRRKISAKIAFA